MHNREAQPLHPTARDSTAIKTVAKDFFDSSVPLDDVIDSNFDRNIDEDGWFTNPSRVSDHDENANDGEFVKAVTIESIIKLVPPSITRELALGSSSSLIAPYLVSSARDVRRFEKNFVRTVPMNEILSIAAMDKVLPKESERELQLRLEAEKEEARNLEAEEIFSDKLIRRQGLTTLKLPTGGIHKFFSPTTSSRTR